MKAKKVVWTLLLLIAVGVAGSSSGCRKKKDTIAKIYVLDASNSFVSGASVRLYAVSTEPNTPPTNLDVTATSDASGVATFNFNDVYQLGQAGVAVLNIKAKHGNLTGTGIIKIEEETTSEVKVFVQ